MATSYGNWEPVIGLEVHAQLLTLTKLFCGCEVVFGAPPNTRTCPVCLGLPGALPMLNGKAVEFAVRAAMALGCEVQRTSRFARKNYFYPDLPKGYQITQYEEPIALGGSLTIEAEGDAGPRVVRLVRIHMEEDAGKSVHKGAFAHVDLNRAGTPLIEIVSHPDLRSGKEAADYLRKLSSILMAIGVNDGNLEEGSFRCDANVSIRPRGQAVYGTRTELKNINSFRFVEDAIEIEIERQIIALETGQKIIQETRSYVQARRQTVSLRSKENEDGYRYFNDPDLLPLVLTDVDLDRIGQSIPELPETRRARLIETHGLTPYAASVITSHPRLADYFETAAELGGRVSPTAVSPVRIANFFQAEVLRDTVTRGLSADFPMSEAHLVGLLGLVEAGTINGKQAKDLYLEAKGTGQDPTLLGEGLRTVRDEGALKETIALVLAENEKQVLGYRAGKLALFGFLVGQVMRKTKGAADPARVNDLLRRELDQGKDPP